MKRILACLLLLGLGVMLSLNAGRLHSLLCIYALRNPLSIAVTSFLHENASANIFRFEQDILQYFCLGPYFLCGGVLAGLAMTSRNSVCGVMLPIGFAASFSILLFRESMKWGDLHWIDFLPDMIAAWCLAPIFLIGLGIGELLRNRRFPQWRILDCFAVITIACALCYAVVYRPFAVLPSICIVSFGLLAWRMLAGIARGTPAEDVERNSSDQRSAVG